MAFLIPENLRSRKDVSQAIRRTASAFQVGLREDASVWYEPPFDPTGAKPHFVVLLPDRGVIVLEVLDANAKGVLGAVRGKIRLDASGNEVEADNPVIRAEALCTTLRERIEREPRLASLDIPVVAGAVITSVERAEAPELGLNEVIDLDRCVFRCDLEHMLSGENEDRIIRLFTKMLGGLLRDPLEGENEQLVRGILQPDTVIDRLADAEKSDDGRQLVIFRPPTEGDIVRVMDRRQESLAKNLGSGHRVIRGVAGSGKTLILLYRARLLSRLMPAGQILVTCFNRSLAAQLKNVLADCDNVRVANLDSLMVWLIHQTEEDFPGYDGGNEEIIRLAHEALDMGFGQRYDAVLMDEAQDFGNEQLRFAVRLLKEGCDDLLVVADAAQNIYRKSFSWRSAGIEAAGRTRILRVNYRNTHQVLDFANRFLLMSSDLKADEVPDLEDENTIIPPESAARQGERPRVRLVDEVAREVSDVTKYVEFLSRKHTAPGQIALLYPQNYFEGYPKARKIYDGLRQAGIRVFWATDPDNRSNRDRIGTTVEPVVMSTIHSAKGLEFPHVVLAGVWHEGLEIDGNRHLMYVGMTRATETLVVIATKGTPLSQDVAKAAREVDTELGIE